MCVCFSDRIWTFGARHVRLYVNSTLVFEGQLEKGCGNQVFDYSISIELQEPHLPECTSSGHSPHDPEPQESNAGVSVVETSQDKSDPVNPGTCMAEMQRASLERDTSPPLDLTLPAGPDGDGDHAAVLQPHSTLASSF